MVSFKKGVDGSAVFYLRIYIDINAYSHRHIVVFAQLLSLDQNSSDFLFLEINVIDPLQSETLGQHPTFQKILFYRIENWFGCHQGHVLQQIRLYFLQDCQVNITGRRKPRIFSLPYSFCLLIRYEHINIITFY